MKSAVFLLLFSTFLISGCSNSESANTPPADPMSQKLSPYLELANFIKDGCLNLELLSNYFDDAGFEYPGRAVTYDYTSSADNKALFTRNFGVRELSIKTFPLLKNIKQNDCAQASIETAYGRKIPFNIVNYKTNSVQMELANYKQEETESAYLEAYATEPIFRRIQIELTSPTHLMMTVDAETLHPRCNNKVAFTYTKSTVYRWAPSSTELPIKEEIAQIAYDKVLEIIDPSRIPAIPMPPLNETSELVRPSEFKLELSVDEIKQIQKILPVVALDNSCR